MKFILTISNPEFFKDTSVSMLVEYDEIEEREKFVVPKNWRLVAFSDMYIPTNLPWSSGVNELTGICKMTFPKKDEHNTNKLGLDVDGTICHMYFEADSYDAAYLLYENIDADSISHSNQDDIDALMALLEV